MREGYYWARGKVWATEENAEWEIVSVHLGWVDVIGDESGCAEEYYEFGEEIERPMTDDEIEAMEA